MTAAFQPGDRVRIRADQHAGHHRTPLYVKGKQGVVFTYRGEHRNPETLAYGEKGLPRIPVYSVGIPQRDLWAGYSGPPDDTLVVDVFEHWLERSEGIEEP